MFELTKAQKGIQKAAKDFAKGEFDKELAYELERDNEFPTKIWEKAADLGFIGIHFPEAYSGGAMGLLESVLIAEEFCRKDSSIGGALIHASYAAECLLRFGSDELKSTYLPKIAEGEILSAGAFSESDHGSEEKTIETSAKKDSDEWIINGTKKYVFNGAQAGFYIVLCQTDPDASPTEKGQSMILVESDRQGISIEKVGKKIGGNMTTTATVTFKDVRVPSINLVGKEGKGYDQLQAYLNESRIILAGQALGTSLGMFDRMMDYVKGREQFGKKLAQFQISQHKIADMATKIELAKLITYKAAWSADNGQLDAKLSSMAKMTAARTAMEVGGQTIQLYGGYGFMTEYEVERYYRDAKVIELQTGARDIQKDIISGAIIGKIK